MNENNKRRKKLTALLVLLTFIFTSILPTNIVGWNSVAEAANNDYNPTSRNNVTITIEDEDGNKINNANITVARGSNTYTVNAQGNGQYQFTKDNTSYRNYYNISVSANGYVPQTVSLRADKTSLVLILEDMNNENWQTFRVFYIASGILPSNYAASGEVGNYGPSGNNTPLVEIEVDINKLRREYASVINYQENTSDNDWQVTPVGDQPGTTGESQAKAKENAIKFWEAVWACMSDASKSAFEATGLDDNFCGYVLKKIKGGDQHADGFLNITPPAYVTELYDQGDFFGGEVTGADDMTPQTIQSVLAQYAAHIGAIVTWNYEPNSKGEYSGEYTAMENGREYRYRFTVRQTNYAQATDKPNDKVRGDIHYEHKTDLYYLATFDMAVEKLDVKDYLITYTDGVATEFIFENVTEQIELPLKGNETVPAFAQIYGNAMPKRTGYTFVGWYLDGSNNTIYSDEDVQKLSVTGDMTFHAVWKEIPKEYTAKLEVILNGTYDADDEIAIGERIDLTTVLGNQTKVYLKPESEDKFIELVRQSQGVYTANVVNGNYYIYYSVDGGTNKIAGENGQMLIINNADRTRYLFLYSIDYDLDGGSVTGGMPVEYYYINSAANVSEKIPTKDGFRFAGWKDQDGNIYQPSDKLTDAISKQYTLTAQWERMANVNLTVILNHVVPGGGIDPDRAGRDMVVDLAYRASTTEPYVEVVEIAEKVFENCGSDNESTTIFKAGLYQNLDINYEYSVNAFVEHYSIVGEKIITVTTNSDGSKTYNVTITMRYDPDLFNLQYKIVAASSGEHSIPDNLIPKAVDLKVVAWDANAHRAWAPISAHKDYSADVLIDEIDAQGTSAGSSGIARYGTGSYGVPAYRESTTPYYYRVAVAGFTLADGTELTASEGTASGQEGIYYYSDSNTRSIYGQGAFYATVEVTSSEAINDGLRGAYGVLNSGQLKQQGNIVVTVYMDAHKVIFNPNGGTLNNSPNSLEVANQFTIPKLSSYVPVRADNYVFDNWYVDANKNGQIDENETIAKSGEVLTEDVTLIAKWKDPISVDGTVTMAGTYAQDSLFIEIPDIAKAKTTEILLQKQDANGYWETIREATVSIDYTQKDYYYQGRVVGMGTFKFENLPNNGIYRVKMLSPNYHATYQHEPDSVDTTKMKDYPSYQADENGYVAILGTVDPLIATVNAHMHYEPESFDLHYEVNATAIGEKFRPKNAEVLITYTANDFVTKPNLWPVISQMERKDNSGVYYEGQITGLASYGGVYKGTNEIPVWNTLPDGSSYYYYGLCVHRVDNVLYDANTAPFSIQYQAPAYVTPSGQNQMLIATLQPKQYDVIFNTNGGNKIENRKHTWSFTTNIADVIPEKSGYTFDGWYDNAELVGAAVTSIDASVANDTTLYAKWRSVQDKINLTVTIHHVAESGGEAGNYDKDLHVQLTSALKNTTNPHEDVSGQSRDYGEAVWHTQGDDVDTEIVEIRPVFSGLDANYDYSLNVLLDGYYVESKVVTHTTDVWGITTYDVAITLQYKPDLLNFTFGVEMKDGIDKTLWPVSAEVKVTCWYDPPSEEISLQWNTITQHLETALTVYLDDTGKGTVSYPVWQWLHAPGTTDGGADGLPYYYRIEVISLKLKDGTTLLMANGTGTDKDVVYNGENYNATIVTDINCDWVKEQDTTATTDLEGAYGVISGNSYTQKGEVKAVIDVTPYSVTLNPNGGTFGDGTSANKVFSNQIKMPDISAYTPQPGVGYKFAGWQWTVGKTVGAGEWLTENVELTAQWEPISYTVYYHENGGNDVADTVYTVKDAVVCPEPTRQGYTFKGWYENSTFTGNPVTGYALGATGNKHLYAKWEINSYTITVTVENGTANMPNTFTVNYGDNRTIAFTANIGYKLGTVTVDGKQAVLTDGKYTFAAIDKNHSIDVKYVKDDSQTKDLSYTVRHVLRTATGQYVEQTEDTRTHVVPVWINDNTGVTIQANTVLERTYTGYKLQSMSPTVQTGDKVADGTVITFVYEVDDSQQKELTYTVKHIVEDTERDVKNYTQKVWVNATNTATVNAEHVARKNYYGYRFAGYSINDGSIVTTAPTSAPDRAVIKVHYERDAAATKDVWYVVNHDVGGTIRYTQTYTDKVWVHADAKINIVPNSLSTTTSYIGYVYKETVNAPTNGGMQVDSETVITLKYAKDEGQKKTLSYTIQHEVDGKIVDQHVHTTEVWVNAPNSIPIVETDLDSKTYTGYTFKEYKIGVTIYTQKNYVPLAVDDNTTIILVYEKDENQTKQLSYTVEHVIVDEQNPSGKVRKSATTTQSGIWVNAPDKLLIQDGTITTETYLGYKFNRIEPSVKVGDEVDSGMLIRLYYVPDAAQTKELAYTVKHVVGAEERDEKTHKQIVWLNEADTATVDAGSITQNSYYGYNFVGYSIDDGQISNTAPATVKNGTIIKLHYQPDTTMTKDVYYVVNHKVGEEIRTTETYKETVWVNTNTITVTATSITTKSFIGYKFDKMEPAGVNAGAVIDSGTVITLEYVKDETQKKNLSYTIQHLVKGVDGASDKVVDQHVHVEKDVWVNAPNTLNVVPADLVSKGYTGYEFKQYMIGTETYTQANVPSSVADNTTIVLVYEKDENQTKQLSYMVEHVIVDASHPEGLVMKSTRTTQGGIWINAANKLQIQAGTITTESYVGYKFKEMIPVVQVGDKVESGTLIKLFYKKDSGQTKKVFYTVKHLIEGVEREANRIEYEADVWINDPSYVTIQSGHLQTITYQGYKFSFMSPSGMQEGQPVLSGRIITLNYVKDDSQTKPAQYTVKHVLIDKNAQHVEQTTDTRMYTVPVWVNDTTVPIQAGSIAQKTYLGYKYDHTEYKGPDNSDVSLNGGRIVDGAVITLYYKADDSQTKTVTYKVQHNVAGQIQDKDTKSYSDSIWVNAANEITIKAGSLTTNSYLGYKFKDIDPMTAEEGKTIASGSTITLNYVVDDNQTKVLTYYVRHIVEGIVQDIDTYTETVWIHAPNVLTIKSDGLQIRNYAECKLIEPISHKIGDQVNNGTVIDLHYAKNRYTVTYQYEGDVPPNAPVVPTAQQHAFGSTLTVASTPSAIGFTFSGWQVASPSDVSIVGGEFTMPASNMVLTGTWETVDATPYKVNFYQQERNGNYKLFDYDERSTTTGQLVWLDREDKLPAGHTTTPSIFAYAVTPETIERATVAADGSTELRSFFEQRFRVVFKYWDEQTRSNRTVYDTGYVYRLGDAVLMPDITAGLDGHTGWYVDMNDAQLWNGGKVSDNLNYFDVGTNTMYLYTKAKVEIPAEGDLTVTKKLEDGVGPANGEYGFELKLDITFPQVTLTPEQTHELHRLASAEIFAKDDMIDAEASMKAAMSRFENNVSTTRSAYAYILLDDGFESVRAITTSGSVYRFDAFDSFDVYGGSANESIVNKIVNFIKGLTEWPSKSDLLHALHSDIPNTSGSAIAFRVTDAERLFEATQAYDQKYTSHQLAWKELQDFLTEANMNKNSIKVQVNRGGETTVETLTVTDNVAKLNFKLKANESIGFKFNITSGSAIQYTVTETDVASAKGYTYNGVTISKGESMLGWTNGTGSTSGDITTGSSIDLVFTNKYTKDEEKPTPPSGGGGGRVPTALNGVDHFGYIVGYEDGTVRPTQNITRAEVAAIFYRLLNEPVRAQYYTADNDFADVNAGDWFNEVVSTLAAMGVVGGYPDGKYHPNAPITRAEFAAISVRFDHYDGIKHTSFTDISDHWAEQNIATAASNGWVAGYEDSTFRPDQYITRAEVMAILNRVLMRLPQSNADLLPGMITWADNADTSAWYYTAVQEATNSHEYVYKNKYDKVVYETWTKLTNE